jgi:N-acetylmuramoyl-L-alanine amidase
MKVHHKLFMVSLLMVSDACAQNYNQLQKILHNKRSDQTHTNDSANQVLNLQVGSLVFCFEQEPNVKYDVKDLSSNKQEHTFFIPNAKVESQEGKKTIAEINRFKSTQYIVSVAMKNQEKEHGLFISIIYNSDEVQLAYELFDSISMQRCINIRLYDKKVLNRLKSAQQPALVMAKNHNKPAVVIDYGHGGLDSGAKSATNVLEKDVSFTIGSLVTAYLQEQDITVFLSRNADITVPLDERITYTNSVSPSLFVSIHANGSTNPASSGIETFYYDYAILKPQKNMLSFPEKLIVHRFHEMRAEQSKKLATLIHSMIISYAQEIYTSVIDRQVKRAIPQVLLGIETPGVLVELGFLSNNKEAELLGFSTEYQKKLAQAIAHGVIAYLSFTR